MGWAILAFFRGAIFAMGAGVAVGAGVGAAGSGEVFHHFVDSEGDDDTHQGVLHYVVHSLEIMGRMRRYSCSKLGVKIPVPMPASMSSRVQNRPSSTSSGAGVKRVASGLTKMAKELTCSRSMALWKM